MRDMEPGPRVLLKRLRDLMAEAAEPQQRLDQIVREIARNMVAEVCSLYVLRSDSVLELYATEGLNPGSVHSAQLQLGQGLVGTIAASARPLSLSEAQKHPAFTYLPETGEEIYNSFLGVPVLRAGRTLGVLVVQNRANRQYRDDEMEALETTAMVIAEMIATGDLSGLTRTGIELDLTRPVTVKGLSLNDGVGLGHVVLHEPRVVVTNLFNENFDDELRRLDQALNLLRVSIDDMLERREVAFEGEHREVLEAYRMFANDRGWVRRLEEAVRNGLTAEAAVEKVQSDMRARMMHMTDPYLRERMSDFDDLANRLLRQLMGRAPEDVAESLPSDSIVIARNMGAAELLDYPREKLRGLVLEEGAPTSHVVIVARALGIPVVGQAKGAVSMAENGDAIIVDGDDGTTHLRPQSDVETAYAEKVRFRARRQELYRELRDRPAVTKDNVAIDLNMNAGLLVDLPQLEDSGAAGIGLFRTELQFMVAAAFPRAEAQEALYYDVMAAAGEKPVTFRTLDIGGDKVLPYFKAGFVEENPALGWRAIRLTLDRPALFRTQVRALLKASRGRVLRMMLPMVTQLSEIAEARELIDKEVRHLSRFGHDLPKQLKLGAMVEVPALLWQMDELMKAVDFVSVGSNDLFQFVMAVDRSNTQISNRFDTLAIPFLRVLKQIADAGHRNNTPVTLCGELAGRPISAMVLLGLGYRSISMSPASIGPVKAMMKDLPLGDFSKSLEVLLSSGDVGRDVRQHVMDFAETHGITL
ncbi:phosphoenolpyruvate--protein phosphotransferase [Limoniibacter endophyticus]|uniref:phosphoenolpyruvate--protein phosphotransferase n=1 Tax=Limoniibacter endophyticus TaxID=1565040 RepID=A0A8J3GHP1_9HYPH|nr:phosphoenolpyruvate--protein phosphotransferase [Limoniibacter endophyticus]GHC76119.1 phosphoenolpyruvate--protein phosphotransferase [Limoniibacter endophyticus]